MMDTFECIMKEKNIFGPSCIWGNLKGKKFVETFYNQNIQDH